jgi:hypothetical protein
MALIPHVQPGQVIRSNFINALIDEINALQSGAPGAGVAVPDVFGLPLAQARAVITQLSVNLVLGSVFDVFGTAINANSSVNAARLVLGQSPPAQSRVTVGSAVNLTVAAAPGQGGGGGGGTQPVGTVLVGGGQGPSGTITQNATHIFVFPITAALNVQEKFDLKAVVIGQSQPALWKARAVSGTAPNFVEITEITIPGVPSPGTTVNVQVELTVPNNTNGTTATLTLEATSQLNASITHKSNPVTITVGGSAPPPEAITISFQGVQNGLPQQDGTVTVLQPKSRFTYVALVPNAGAYSVTFDAVPAGFNATVFGGTTAPTTQLLVTIDVVKTGNPSPGTLKIRVTDPNNPSTVFGTKEQKLS